MNKLILATNNKGKIKEIKTILSDLELELLTPKVLKLEINVVEDGKTYKDNAAKKAEAFAKITGYPALADDSGLEVDALKGLPGLHSARFAPIENPTDAIRRKYLLEQLQSQPRPWTARFRCIAAFLLPEGKVHFTEGICEGEIIPDERGANGFGYDPIFYLPQLGKTMAELSIDEKNRISHRAKALKAIKPILQELIKL